MYYLPIAIYTKYPPNYHFKPANICLSHSRWVRAPSAAELAASARSFSHTKARIRVLMGQPSSSSTGEELLQNSPIWLLAGLRPLLAVDQSHQLLNHRDFSIGLLTVCSLLLPKWAISERRRKGDSIWKLQSFYNLISEVMFNCFCFILFIRSELLDLALTQQEGSTQGSEWLEVGVKLEAVYHRQRQKSHVQKW